MIRTLLILGGTAEARALAAAATARFPDIRVISSLAGRTIAPRMPVGEVYCGGVGGAGGMAQYIRAENVDAVIDATHPFAEEISRNAAQATERAGVPRMVLMRRPWNFVQPDKVQHFRSINAVVAELQGRGERIFLAIGRQEVNQFNELTDRFFLLRFIDAPQTPPLFADCHVLTGRPGGYDDERRMLQQFAIDTLVAKNGGSDASRAKIDAALDLGISVLLIDPPSPPPPPHADSIDAALDWLETA